VRRGEHSMARGVPDADASWPSSEIERMSL
jgi:hypothetical protein